MIKSIRLWNFKCFEEETISLAPLTILTGINGMGKSSLIQAFLLLRQSYIYGLLKKGQALLNGPLVSLGTSDDVFYDNMKKGESLGFEICANSSVPYKWSFSHCESRNILSSPSNESNDDIYKENLFNDNFYYLQAERIGPRTSFKMSDENIAQYNCIGNSGEFCAHFFSQRERQKIKMQDLRHKKEQKILEIRNQTEAWISEISPNTRIHLREHIDMDEVNLSFSFIRGNLPSRNFRPTNVGFGLTYTLPIFVSVLSSKPGSLIIIENPEAHVHPRGQSVLGNFLSIASANGIQIILETHSDHILNGIRIAVKSGKISPEKVAIHFFDFDKNSTHTKVTSPKIDKDGRLDQWPEGFFDEWEKGLSELL